MLINILEFWSISLYLLLTRKTHSSCCTTSSRIARWCKIKRVALEQAVPSVQASQELVSSQLECLTILLSIFIRWSLFFFLSSSWIWFLRLGMEHCGQGNKKLRWVSDILHCNRRNQKQNQTRQKQKKCKKKMLPGESFFCISFLFFVQPIPFTLAHHVWCNVWNFFFRRNEPGDPFHTSLS